MKSIVVVCVLFGLASALTVPHSRGCIYILGRCHEECPEGTHAYALGCGYKTPEATCKQPNPVAEDYMLCDFSDCYCDPPTLRDESTGKCVLKENCSKDGHTPATTLLPPHEGPKPSEKVPTPEKPADKKEQP
ncbi:uncharacterized protein [Epargyreus clarus]|uniref:uncharacterized protein n=1 Tax=Epargyreus clarus TaxID=520877 RepID=UPI003C30D863